MTAPVLTPEAKLACFRLRFYDYHRWEPKVGDYYTTCRDDMDLLRIMERRITADEEVYVCRQISGDSFESGDDFTWPVEGFTTEGFGDRRLFVHPSLLLAELPGRPHKLTWDGVEWKAPCGCAYHPDDDKGTHGGAPHVHLCDEHKEAQVETCRYGAACEAPSLPGRFVCEGHAE